MTRLSYILATTLAVSIGLNLFLWLRITASNDAPSIAQHSINKQQLASQAPSFMATNSSSDESIDADLSAPTEYPHNEKLKRAKALLRAGEFEELISLLQNHLRAFPTDIAFLLVEADLIQQTEPVSFALAHYYELLEFDLSSSQRTQVNNKISALVEEHAGKLSNINAWDILATFVEPLWQREPNNRNYILTLAESYAHQALIGPTENILASLLPDDPEVLRIRAILPFHSAQPDSQEQQPEPINQEDYRRAVGLAKIGDQFIVETNLVGQPLELLIDTGATTTVISESAFAQASDRIKRSGMFLGVYEVNTAGGKVEAPIYRFPWLAVGGLAVRDAAVVIMPTLNFARADGLLGMNFLREFDFRIDQQQAVLYLK